MKRAPATISAVSRAMAIVEWLADRPDGAAITQMSDALEIELSIVSRLVATLEQDGFVRRMSTARDRYALGFRLAGAVYRHMSHVGIPEVCMPVLHALSKEVRELVQLAVVDDNCVRFIAKSDADQRITLRGLVGRVARPDTMATGKAWLAWLSDGERLDVLAASQSDIPKTVDRDMSALLAELEGVRRDGFAIEIEGNIEDVAAVAAPVWAGAPARVVAVLTISGPSYRLDEDKLRSMSVPLMQAASAAADLWPAAALSQQLGWAPLRLDEAS